MKLTDGRLMLAVIDGGSGIDRAMGTGVVDEPTIEPRQDSGSRPEAGGLRERIGLRQRPAVRRGDGEAQPGLQELREVARQVG